MANHKSPIVKKYANLKNGYDLIHAWVRYHYGKADHCTNKDCEGKTSRFEYALIHGKSYDRNIKNYKQLCGICHRKYDLTKSGKEKVARARKGKRGNYQKRRPILVTDTNGNKREYISIFACAVDLGFPHSVVAYNAKNTGKLKNLTLTLLPPTNR